MGTRFTRVVVSLVSALALASTTYAQASRPDLSGICQKAGGGPGLIEAEPPMTAW